MHAQIGSVAMFDEMLSITRGVNRLKVRNESQYAGVRMGAYTTGRE